MLKRLVRKKPKKMASTLPKIPRVGGTMSDVAMEKRFAYNRAAKSAHFNALTSSSAYGITAKSYQKNLGKGAQYNFVRRSWDDKWVRTPKFVNFQVKNPKALSAKMESLITKKIGPASKRANSNKAVRI